MGLFDGTTLEQPVLCARCGEDEKVCDCPPLATLSPRDLKEELAPSKQRLKLRIEKRKRGKVVTVVAGLSGSSGQRVSLLTELKNLCGAGGTQADANLEIQGDHVLRIREFLIARGFKVAQA